MTLPKIKHAEQNDQLLKMKGVSLVAFLDTTRPRADNTYTVRLRVIHNREKKLYTTKLNLNIEDYIKLAEGGKLRKLHANKSKLYGKIREAYDIIINELDEFSFTEFERKFLNQTSEYKYVKMAIEFYITKLRNEKRYGTASSYQYTLSSIAKYLKERGKNIEKFEFKEISENWLNNYVEYMRKEGKSTTTVGIYLRALRSIYNYAIQNNGVKAIHYPFGKGRFKIPVGRNTKKAISKDVMKILFNGKPQTPEQIKAKDFWFFSYCCNGMNVKDIANIRIKDIKGDHLSFIREKTKRTTNQEVKVNVVLNEFAKNVIEKYGCLTGSKDDFVFSIISRDEDYEQRFRKTNIFCRYINQHFKAYAKSLNIEDDVNLMTARHTFATNCVLNGYPLEFVSEALAHTDMKTTQNYFAGFTDDIRKEVSDKLLNF